MLSPSAAARLATQLECLPILLDGASPEALGRRTPSGRWSVHENLAHLARHHAVFLARVHRVLSEDSPALPRYAAEEDPEWPAWSALPPGEVLERLRSRRLELMTLVSGLSDEALARTARHPVFGPMALTVWIEFFLLHEAHHLFAILKRARGGE
ncbi:MAG TPA: DinB family protein [Vicinamibacteria bacterium]|nr:DinB family protein [Vicinamibacteria bacterium]